MYIFLNVTDNLTDKIYSSMTESKFIESNYTNSFRAYLSILKIAEILIL